MAQLPGVRPGTCTARGEPGTSIDSPAAKEETSLIGIARAAPRVSSQVAVRHSSAWRRYDVVLPSFFQVILPVLAASTSASCTHTAALASLRACSAKPT